MRRELEAREFTVYQLYFELLPMARAAHRSANDDMLRKIYGFADWCRVQHAKDLWNAVGVAFYEHLFDEWAERECVVPWLSPGAVDDSWALWEWRLTPERVTELRRLFGERKVHRWRECSVEQSD